MAIFGGIVVSNDQMGNVRCKIVLVSAAKIGGLLGNLSLYGDMVSGDGLQLGLWLCSIVNRGLLTRRSASILVQQSTRPSKGLEGSNGLSGADDDSIIL